MEELTQITPPVNNIPPVNQTASSEVTTTVNSNVTPEVTPTVTPEVTPSTTVAPVSNVVTPPVKPEVNLDDFEKAMEGLNEAGKMKPKEVSNPEPPKPEAVKTVVPAVVAPSPTTTPIIPQVVNGRDYSDLTEEEVPLFKSMSNESFNKLKPVYMDYKKQKDILASKDAEIVTLKQGKQQLPENYYQHQDAYVLTPEFKENAETLQVASGYQNYWAEQLLKIKKQEDWEPLVQNAQGQWVKGAKMASTPEAELQVMNNYQAMSRLVNETQAKNNVLAQSHVQKYQQDIGAVSEGVKKFYGYLDTPENATQYKPQIEMVKGLMPKAFHSNPLFDGFVKATVTSMLFQNALKIEQTKNTKTATVQKTIADDAIKAGPNNSTITAPGNGAVKPQITVEDFDKFMHS